MQIYSKATKFKEAQNNSVKQTLQQFYLQTNIQFRIRMKLWNRSENSKRKKSLQGKKNKKKISVLQVKFRKREIVEYTRLSKIIRNKCKQEKEQWLNDRFAKIKWKKQCRIGLRAMHKNIKKTGQETYSSAGCITSKKEIIIMGKEKALLRWI